VLDKFRANASLALPADEVDALAEAFDADRASAPLDSILEPLRRARPQAAPRSV
jgi:hypothetical protein